MLSFPRSASSFIRYCVEKITNKKTLDCGGRHYRVYGNYANGEPILRKEHFLKRVNLPDVSGVILILRNYKDVFISHNLRDVPLSNVDFIYSHLNKSEKHYFKEYYGLINFYETYRGKKMLLYYEDVIKNPYETIRNVLDFLLPENDYDFDEETILQFEKSSKKNYMSYAGSKSSEKKKLHTILTDEQNYEFDELFKRYNQYLYDKYLIRYLYKNK